MTIGNPNRCYYCGNGEVCTKDHFWPKSYGGKLTVYACAVCQGSKKDKAPLVWLEYITEHNAISEHIKPRITKAVLELFEKYKDDPKTKSRARV